MDLKDTIDLNARQPIQLDDALTMTKFGKFNYFVIGISGIILSAGIIETLGIGFVLPVACDLDLTTTQKNILSTVLLIGIIVSSHLWGFLGDTRGRKKVIAPTLFLSFLFTALSSLANNFTVFAILRFFTGFFISASSGTVYAFLSEFHNTKNSARAILAASTIMGIGAILVPGLAWIIINQEWSFYIPVIGTLYKPWRLFVLACGIPSLFCSLALIKLPETPKFVFGQGKEEEAIKILRKIYSWNTGKKGDTLIIPSIIKESSLIDGLNPTNTKNIKDLLKSMWAQTVPVFSSKYLRSTVIACSMEFWIYATGFGMYFWYPTSINHVAEYRFKYPDEAITICEIFDYKKLSIANSTSEFKECSEIMDASAYEVTFILEILYSVGFALSGVIINLVGKLSILVVVLVVCGIFGVATAFTNMPLVSTYFYLVLLLCALATPVVNAATVDIYPTNIRAMAVCILLMMGRLGGVIGTNIFGTLIDVYCPASFLLSGISLIACGLLAFLIPNIRQKSNMIVEKTSSINTQL